MMYSGENGRCGGGYNQDQWNGRSNCVGQLYRHRADAGGSLGSGRLMQPSYPVLETRIIPDLLRFNLPCKNLIVNYLPQKFTDKNLYDIFVPFGPIHSVKIMREGVTGYSHGYGFVNFLRQEDAMEALQAVHGRQVERNKYLKVSFARPPCEEIKNTNLYISDLPPTMTVAELGAIFGQFGPILQKNLLFDKVTGRPRGTAFVRFAYRDDAARAVSCLNNFVPLGTWKPIHVKIAKEHGRQNPGVFYRRNQQTNGFAGNGRAF